MTWEPQKEYELRVEERNAARRELVEARAWMVNAAALLKVVSGYVSHERFPGVAQELLDVAQACPLPTEDDDGAGR